ncbi:ankyrin repeat-containing domain protein [Xylariaceae sp. FL0255]|nr:ankyrin repeat-containing domain protein [Xylariaceae sp. FL0255]
MASSDWEQYRSTILNLYLIEKLPLRDVITYMNKEHSFTKNKSQYEYQFKKWGIRKNFSKQLWRFLDHHMKKRNGRATEITLHGLVIPLEKVHKETTRYADIPTAFEFGRREASPSMPKGLAIRVKTPSITNLVFWPSTLPWFEFKAQVLPALRDPSAFLKFFIPENIRDEFSLYSGANMGTTILSALRNPHKFHQSILHLTKSIPQDIMVDYSVSEAPSIGSLSASIAKTLLEVFFFRLSNGLERHFDNREMLREHDQLVLHLVKAVSRSNPGLLDEMLSKRKDNLTSNSVKEEVYGCAIRERDYELVGKLLDSGIDPNLHILNFHWLDPSFHVERGKLQIQYQLYKFGTTGLEEAALTCDIRLGKMMLVAGANPNHSSMSSWVVNGIIECNIIDDTVSPLALTAFSTSHAEAVRFSRLLIEYGSLLNSPQRHCPRCRRMPCVISPLTIAIAQENHQLIETLINMGAGTSVIDPCMCLTLNSDFSIIPLSTFSIASASSNSKMIEQSINPIFAHSERADLRQIRDVFITSCAVGDIFTVTKLLDLEIDLNNHWPDDLTPLVATSWNPDITIAQMLLARDAHASSSHWSQEDIVPILTPLHVAAYHGLSALVQMLIDVGADCNIRIKTLPEPGPYSWLVEGDLLPTALQNALVSGDTNTIELLLLRSEIVGGELLQAAYLDDATWISHLLSRGASILDVGPEGETVLDAAAATGNIELMREYFTAGGIYRSRALYQATNYLLETKYDDSSTIQLLASNRPIAVIDRHEASSIVLCLKEGRMDLIDMFLRPPFLPGPSQSHYSRKDDMEIRYHCSNSDESLSSYFSAILITPLSAAMHWGQPSTVMSLIKSGYPLGMSEIATLALGSDKRFTRVSDEIQSLIWSWYSPQSLDLAARQALVLWAISLGNLNKTQEYAKLIPSVNFELYMRGLDSNSLIWCPLSRAAKDGNKGIVNLLLESGADVNWPSQPNRETALTIAAMEGQLEMVELLLEKGATVDAPRRLERGATALQYSALKGHLHVAKTLVSRGANVNAPPAKDRGVTALEGASMAGRLDMVQFLLDAGAGINGEMRIHYVRAVGFATQNGHQVIANHLKRQGAWKETDDALYNQHHVLDASIHFRYSKELNRWFPRKLLWEQGGGRYLVEVSEDGGFTEVESDESDEDSTIESMSISSDNLMDENSQSSKDEEPHSESPDLATRLSRSHDNCHLSSGSQNLQQVTSVVVPEDRIISELDDNVRDAEEEDWMSFLDSGTVAETFQL